jgi:WD40 repeat protein
MKFSPDGTRLAIWGSDVHLWSTRSRTKLASLVHELDIEQVVFDPTGQLLATASSRRNDASRQGVIQVWNAGNGKKIGDIPQAGPILALVFSSNGQRLIAIDDKNHVWIWKLVFRQREPLTVDIQQLLTLAEMDAIWLNAAGKWLATRKDNLLSIWDIERARQSSVFFHDHSHEPINTTTPLVVDGSLLVTWFDSIQEDARQRTVRVWNAEHVDEVQALLAARGLVTSRHHVAGVGYTNICIAATVVRKETMTQVAALQEEICTALRAFFHPLLGGPERKGWPLARPVHASEVYQIIEGVDGVDHVEALHIMPCDVPGQQSTGSLAHIALPDHHLVNCLVQPDNFTIVAPGAVAIQHRMHRVQAAVR